jgi:hypothetical protein
MRKPLKRPRPISPIAKYPSYVKAIGMVSVEFTALEIMLGELLGSLLHIDKENGKIIYLTPHTGFGRIAILENLNSDGKNLFRKEGKAHKSLTKLLKRARALMQKRHDTIHNSWGIATRETEQLVATRKTPFLEKQPVRPVQLEELHRLSADIRNLANDVRDLAETCYASWPPYSSRPTPIPTAPQSRTRKPTTRQHQKKETAATPTAQPQS